MRDYRAASCDTEPMTNDLVLLDIEETVATVTINNPAKRGALSLEAMRLLIETFLEVGARPDVHVVILASVGKVFSSGHNLAEMAGNDRTAHEAFFHTSAELMLTIRRIPQPVIARVHADAAAAGCQLVAGCDLAVAADHVRFSIAGLRIGMFPTLPAVSLSRTVGDKIALRMLLTGDQITAEHALQYGLVSHVVPADVINEATLHVAQQIAQYSRSVVGIGKQAYYAQAELGTEAAYDHAVEAVIDNVLLPDGQEGINAFLEKRAPVWNNT